MINTETLLKARSELTRLNMELRELHLEEERCKLRRSRLEADKARVQALVDFCELAQRLSEKPLKQTSPSFHLEDCHGAKLVVVDKPIGAAAAAPGRHRPAGIPTMPEMVLAVLEHEAEGLRPCDITRAVREKWPDAKISSIGTVAWQMARDGRLAKDGAVYKLNGRGH